MRTSLRPADPALAAEANAAPKRLQNRRAIAIGITAGLIAYLLLAVFIYWPVSPWSSSRLVLCGCYDPASEVWWLAYTPFAIAHHLNLFGTNYLNYPIGVNLAQQTDPPLLGLIMSPITYSLGPVAALNLCYRLAFFTSATAMFLVLRRFTSWLPAAFIGGLLYAFGPYVVGQGSMHFTLAFVPFPPLILAAVYELVVRQRHSARRAGTVLGLLAAGQYLISPEILAGTVVVAVLGLVLGALSARQTVRERLGRVIAGLAWAILPFAVICGYPIAYLLGGPHRVTGPIVPHGATRLFSADLLSPIVPTTNELIGPAHLKAIGSSFVASDLPENGAYLGIPLLIVLAVVYWRTRRRAIIRLLAVLGAFSYLVALGPRLMFDNRLSPVPLLFDIYLRLPLISDALPVRSTLFVDLCAAAILAIGLDDIVRSRGQHSAASGTSRGWLSLSGPPLAALALGAFALVPIIPNAPYYQPPTGVPTGFLTGRPIQRIPVGSVVLTYPFPNKPRNEAMIWQAVTHLRFKLIGGYGAFPNPDGTVTLSTPQLPPATIEQLFLFAADPQAANKGLPPPNQATLVAMRAYCAHYHVRSIIAQVDHGQDGPLAVTYLRAAFGRPSRYGDVDAWFNIDRELKRPIPGFSSKTSIKPPA